MIDLLGGKDPWVPSTSGEQLLFLLLNHHLEWQVLADDLRRSRLRIGRRHQGLSNFFVGASVLHLQQRLLRLAQDVSEDLPFGRHEQGIELRARVCDVIQLTPLDYDGDFAELIEEVLTSAEQQRAGVSASLKRIVLRNGPDNCYSCGRFFGVPYEDEPGGLEATVDHIWPRALGGNSNEENLVPACNSCNSAKGHIASWQMAWIQPIVFADADEEKGLGSLRLDIKVALHIRAAMTYAQLNSLSLKESFLALGPRDEPPVRIDPEQGYDFFNIRVHDPALANVDWMPS